MPTKATPTPSPTEQVVLAAKVDQRNRLKDQLSALASALGELDAEIIAEMQAADVVQIDGILTKGVTLVSPEGKPGWNTELLAELVGARVWSRITKRVLDPVLLDAEILLNRIDNDAIAAAVTPAKPIAPHLKVR